MTSFRRRVLIRIFQLFDLAVLSLSLALAEIPVSHLSAKISFVDFLSMRVKVRNILVIALILVLWHFIFLARGLYRSRRLGDRRTEVKDVLKATLTATLSIVLAALVFRIRMITPLAVLCFWLLSTIVILLSRLLLRSLLGWIRSHGRNLRQILIVGTNLRAIRFAQTVENTEGLGYRLVGFVDNQWAGLKEFAETGYRLLSDIDRFPAFLREHVVDEVAIALPMKSYYPQAAFIVEQCEQQGILVRCLSDLFALRRLSLPEDEFDHDPVIPVCVHSPDGWPAFTKRLIDVAISVSSLIVLSPLFLVAAVLITFDSPGPIFFTQERIGLNKRHFRMYKLRTMVDGADRLQALLEERNELRTVFKIKNDPRITPVGKILRKFSIDEIPQLFNVLKGDMSLVGPRPLPIRDYEGFDLDWHRRRFAVRPGITCLWQINGRSSISFEKWMELDMQYIDQWSLWLDLKILAKTMPAVLKGTGAA